MERKKVQFQVHRTKETRVGKLKNRVEKTSLNALNNCLFFFSRKSNTLDLSWHELQQDRGRFHQVHNQNPSARISGRRPPQTSSSRISGPLYPSFLFLVWVSIFHCFFQRNRRSCNRSRNVVKST